jgi:NAD(P)H-nitrite reductase large subunit
VELDDTICYCFHVPKRKVLNYLRNCQPRRASQLSGCGGAGTGCGWCIPFLEKYFAQWQQGRLTEADATTPDEYARQRGSYIRAGRGVPPPGAIPIPDAPDAAPPSS